MDSGFDFARVRQRWTIRLVANSDGNNADPNQPKESADERETTIQRLAREIGFKQAEFSEAKESYASLEREHTEDPDINVVLVAVKSIKELKEAQ